MAKIALLTPILVASEMPQPAAKVTVLLGGESG